MSLWKISLQASSPFAPLLPDSLLLLLLTKNRKNKKGDCYLSGDIFLFSPKCGFSKVTPLCIGSPGDTQRVCSQSFE